MTDYTNLLERLAVSAGDQECLCSDAKEAIVVLLCAYKSVAKQLHDAEDVLKQNILNEFWRIGVIDGQPGWIQHYCHERKEVVKDPLTLDGELHCTILPAVETIKAERDSLQSRVAEAEDTNKALRVRLGSELHEPVTTVEDRYNADGKSCHITDDLPAGMPLYAAPPVAAPVRLTDEQAEKVDEAIREALGDAYDCLRVWNAWSYGTMRPDDFSQVAEDSDRVAEIRNAAAVALGFKVEGEQ